MNILKLFFLISFLAACNGDEKSGDGLCKEEPNNPLCIEEKQKEAEREKAVQEAKAQESQSFSGVKECLDQKEAEGIADARKNAAVIAECAKFAKPPQPQTN